MWFGAEGFIEINGGGVPIEDGPFQASAAAFDGEFGELFEQGFADAVAATFGEDVEIFEVDAGGGAEGGVVVEEEGEAGRGAVVFTEDHFGVGAWAKESLAERVFGSDAGVGEFLVFGETLDVGEDLGDVGGGGGAERDHLHRLTR